jgi:hypothetical protein
MISVNFPAEYFILLPYLLKKLKRFKVAFAQMLQWVSNTRMMLGVFFFSSGLSFLFEGR